MKAQYTVLKPKIRSIKTRFGVALLSFCAPIITKGRYVTANFQVGPTIFIRTAKHSITL